MKVLDLNFKELGKISSLLKAGKIGIIPTDTIYGIVGSALNPETVEEIYRLRKRAKNKPMIILIADLKDLTQFNISLTAKQVKFLKRVWPNPLSVVLHVPSKKFKYLHRGTKSLAFRIPKNEGLIKLLEEVGPLVAPSVNIEGEKPAETIDEAKKYFADKVAFYIDGGKIKSQPSTVIQLADDGSWKILRQGSYKINFTMR